MMRKSQLNASHLNTLQRYDMYRSQARELAKDSLPSYLKRNLDIAGIGQRELVAFRLWKELPERAVDWDWTFSNRYCTLYPKAFDMSVWFGNTLCSLSLGRPTYKGTDMRLDFVERMPGNCPHAGEMFRISLLAYELYGELIGAKKIRLMNPINDKLIRYYTSFGGFTYVNARKGNPHYLVRDI